MLGAKVIQEQVSALSRDFWTHKDPQIATPPLAEELMHRVGAEFADGHADMFARVAETIPDAHALAGSGA